jgi:hypothetical protein
MAGKAVMPLEAYLVGMDEKVLTFSVLAVLVSLVGVAIAADFVGSLLSGCSLVLSSFLLFCLFEAFPALIRPLHLDIIPYYAYRLTYVPDPVFGFKERPFHRAEIANFRGFGYSPLYRINVPPHRITWATDGEGFRNEGTSNFADVVVIGSSFAEYGDDLEDTFAKRLERKLDGLKVLNYGKAGYGPFQYVDVLRTYGLNKRPKYALLLLYPPADIDGHLATWVETGNEFTEDSRRPVFGNFLPRYRLVVQQVSRLLISSSLTRLQLGFQTMRGTVVHSQVAVLALPNAGTEKVVFLDQHSTKSPDQLLRSREWKELQTILTDFKNVSEQNQIVPLLLHIPASTEIYAEYSTAQSGFGWLQVRDSQVATSRNSEEALSRLARKTGVELISFSPAFRQAAQQGKLIYYRLDSHWNKEGTDIAAQVTAEGLRARAETRKSPAHAEPRQARKGPSRGHRITERLVSTRKQADDPAVKSEDETLWPRETERKTAGAPQARFLNNAIVR